MCNAKICRSPFSVATALVVAAVTCSTHASVHLMQIEQVIGGVNGDTSAQAIQLRMLRSGQSFLSSARINAVDATGSNPVILDDMESNVSNGANGSRVLITTPNFANYTDSALVSDFVMDPIPVSYLAAGSITFTNNSGASIYWRISWGGNGYTGSTSGLLTNDDDGDFGPPVPFALPSTSLQALEYQGSDPGGASSTNAADYALTAAAAVFVNNAGNSFTLVAPPSDSADFDVSGLVDGRDFATWQRNFGGPGGLADGDANNSGTIDGDDLGVWEAQYGIGAAGMSTPEPSGLVLAVCLASALALTRAKR